MSALLEQLWDEQQLLRRRVEQLEREQEKEIAELVAAYAFKERAAGRKCSYAEAKKAIFGGPRRVRPRGEQQIAEAAAEHALAEREAGRKCDYQQAKAAVLRY